MSQRHQCVDMQAEQGEIKLIHGTLTVTEPTGPQSELDLAQLCDIWEHADLLFRHSDYDAALALYRDAATKCKNSLVEGVLVINAGITALHGGRLQLAQEAWLAASDIEALQTLPHFLLGVMAFHKQDFEGAQLAFRKCRKTFPSGKAVLDLQHLGLAFRLPTTAVLENEQTAAHEWFQSIMNRSAQIPALELPHDFPGDLIFEPPNRASLIGRPQGTALLDGDKHAVVPPHANENDRTDSTSFLAITRSQKRLPDVVADSASQLYQSGKRWTSRLLHGRSSSAQSSSGTTTLVDHVIAAESKRQTTYDDSKIINHEQQSGTEWQTGADEPSSDTKCDDIARWTKQVAKHVAIATQEPWAENMIMSGRSETHRIDPEGQRHSSSQILPLRSRPVDHHGITSKPIPAQRSDLARLGTAVPNADRGHKVYGRNDGTTRWSNDSINSILDLYIKTGGPGLSKVQS